MWLRASGPTSLELRFPDCNVGSVLLLWGLRGGGAARIPLEGEALDSGVTADLPPPPDPCSPSAPPLSPTALCSALALVEHSLTT